MRTHRRRVTREAADEAASVMGFRPPSPGPALPWLLLQAVADNAEVARPVAVEVGAALLEVPSAPGDR